MQFAVAPLADRSSHGRMQPLFQDDSGPGLRRWLIGAVACVVAVVAGVLISDQPYLVFAGFAGLLYIGTLSVNARLLAWLVIALQPAALIVPFFPGRPFWWELCALLAWPSLLAYFLVNRQKLADLKFDRLEQRALLALLGYVGVLLFLMAYRGVGIRALGGAQMGGRIYVQQIVLAILPLLMITARFSPKQIYTAAVVGWLLSSTYVIAELTFAAGGGVMHRLLYFFELPTDGLNFEMGFSMTGVRRYGSLAAVATAGLSLLWTRWPLREIFGRKILFTGPIVAVLFGLGLASGYRNSLIIPLIALFYLALIQRFWNFRRIFAAVVAVGVVVVGLYATADKLPIPVQRSISFLPLIGVSPVAKADAEATNADRWEVLKMAIDDVPRYWLAGRGFGIERFDRGPIDPLNSGVMMLYKQGMFYNGFLGALLKTGVVGLVFTVCLVWCVSWLAWDLCRLVALRLEAPSFFERFCQVLSAQWFAVVTSFYLTNGDINFWMQFFALPAALIMVCRRIQANRVLNPNHSTP